MTNLLSSFHLYGLIIGLAILAALQASTYFARRHSLPPQLVDSIAFWLLIPGFIGARLYHVIDKFSYYSQSPLQILYLWQGGLAIYGGIIGGLIGLIIYYLLKLRPKYSFLLLLDAATFGLPLAQSLGRWGNFFNHELYGRPTTLPWGIRIPSEPSPVHPLFLYESLLNLLVFFFFFYLQKTQKPKKGSFFSLYLIFYGLIRFFLEPLRTPNQIWQIHSFPVAQLFSLFSIALGLTTLLFIYRSKPRPKHHPFSSRT